MSVQEVFFRNGKMSGEKRERVVKTMLDHRPVASYFSGRGRGNSGSKEEGAGFVLGGKRGGTGEPRKLSRGEVNAVRKQEDSAASCLEP